MRIRPSEALLSFALIPLVMGSAVTDGDVQPAGQLCTSDLCVGDTAAGSLTLDGAKCIESYSSLLLGNQVGGDGDLFVLNGAQWNGSSGLTIGRRGIGSALIDSGGQVRLGSGIALGVGDLSGSGPGARGDLTVRGAATILETTGLTVSSRNPGSVVVEDGASLTATNFISIGGQTLGEMTVSGAGTRVVTQGSTRVGNGGDANLLVEGGARFETGSFSSDLPGCCVATTTVTGTDAADVPSRLVVNGDLELSGPTSSLDVLGGAEVLAQSFSPVGPNVDVTATGSGSRIEITGGAASDWGDPFAPGDDVIEVDLADGAELVFSHPDSEVRLSTGFGSRGIVRIQSGSRFEAGYIQLGSAGLSFDDQASIFLMDGTLAASDEILIDSGSGASGITSSGSDRIDADVRQLRGDTSVTVTLRVGGDVELGAGEIGLSGATAAYEVVGSFRQGGEFGTLTLASVHDVQVGGSFTQDEGTIELRSPDGTAPAPIQVDGPVAIHGTIHVIANFPPEGTRYALIESQISTQFDGQVTGENLGTQGISGQVVGNRLDLVVPEPGALQAALAAVASLAAVARTRAPRRRRSSASRAAGGRDSARAAAAPIPRPTRPRRTLRSKDSVARCLRMM